MKRMLLIGCGNMGSALLSCWHQYGCLKHMKVEVVNPSPCTLPRSISQRAFEETAMPDVVVLGVKPVHLTKVLADCAKRFGAKPLYLSLAAGVSLAQLKKPLGPNARIIRAIPNMGVASRLGITGLLANDVCSKAEKEWVQELFTETGYAFWAKSDDSMNAVTAVSGSGPGFVFALMEAMEAAALALGFTSKEAGSMVRITFAGASALAMESEVPLSKLTQSVASKGGTTEAGLKKFAEADIQQIFADVLKAAYQRASGKA